MKKIALLGVVLLAVVLILGGYWLYGQRHSTGGFEPQMFVVPSDWGKIASYKIYAGSTWEVNYANDVTGLYQPGVGKFYFIKKIDSGSCLDMDAKYYFDKGLMYPCIYDDLKGTSRDVIGVYQHGIHDISTGQSFLFKGNNNGLLLSRVGDSGASEVPITVPITTDKSRPIFSPKGNYFFLDEPLYEGGGMFSIVSAEDGSALVKDINYGAYLVFSPDEKIVAVQHNYGGMASPAGGFFVMKDGKAVFGDSHLPCQKPADDSDMISAEDNLGIDYLDDNKIGFTLRDEPKNCQAGSYEFYFATQKLIKK